MEKKKKAVPQHQSSRWASDGLLTSGTEAEIWNNDTWKGGPGLRAKHRAHSGDGLAPGAADNQQVGLMN